MNNYGDHNHPLIRKYVQDLSDELAYIPQADREQHVLEIQDHLQSLVKGKIEQGKSVDQAVEETLREFVPVDRLAEQIMNEEDLTMHISRESGSPSHSGVSTKAIVSLVSGIVSIVLIVVPLIGFILAVIGFILGVIALYEIKRSGREGKRLAVAGVVCSCIGVILPILLILISFVTFTEHSTIEIEYFQDTPV